MCTMGPDILIEKNAAASGVLHMSFSRHLRREKQETFALPKSAWQSASNPAGAMLAPIRLTNAGSCPSRQRCFAATAARSAETKGTAQLPCGSGETQGDASPPPVPTSPAPTRLFDDGSHISMIMSVCCHVLYNKRICITWQVLTKIILRRL